jgi:hypothetical protein
VPAYQDAVQAPLLWRSAALADWPSTRTRSTTARTGQLPGRQPGINPQLTQPVSQDLASLLRTRRRRLHPERRSAELVFPVRHGAFPHRLESRSALFHHHRLIGQLGGQEVPYPGEIVELHPLIVEDPAVVARQ